MATLSQHAEALHRIREYLEMEKSSHLQSHNDQEADDLADMIYDLDAAVSELL